MKPVNIPPGEPLYPWARTIDKILQAERIQRMSGPLAHVFSDYSGEHKECPYDVTAVVIADLYASAPWELARRSVRKQYLRDGRRMAFKSLNDHHRRQALVPFLRAADDIAGLCVVVAVRKSIVSLCADDAASKMLTDAISFRRQWKANSFERMLRVTHLIGMLVGRFSSPNQNLYWISDEDALFANPNVVLDLREMLQRFTAHYTPHALGEVGFGTTSIDEGDRFEEDGTAIADLAAGASAEVLTRLAAAAGGHLPQHIAIPYDSSFRPKTEIIYGWLSNRRGRLRKVVIVFERVPPSAFRVFRLDQRTL